MKFFLFFIIYSFLGWVCEDIYVGIGQHKVVNRGFLYGPYCPVYGFGSLLVLCFLWPAREHPILVFVGGVILTSILEYFTSWIMEVLFNERWWDYSTYPFNIHGRVCLKNSLLFGVLALFITYVVHPYVLHFISLLNPELLLIFIYIFAAGFAVDIYCTVSHLWKRKGLVLEIHRLLKELEKEEEITMERIRKSPVLIELLSNLQSLEKSHIAKAFPDRIVKTHNAVQKWFKDWQNEQ